MNDGTLRVDDEQQIRALIERWAEAVHRGAMDAVLADHAEDIVMFDVPPPQRRVRGIAAYERTWPRFFEWQARGARFAIDELDVTSGEDVAFAVALLRCGTDKTFESDPANHLRPTVASARRPSLGGRPRAPLVPRRVRRRRWVIGPTAAVRSMGASRTGGESASPYRSARRPLRTTSSQLLLIAAGR